MSAPETIVEIIDAAAPITFASLNLIPELLRAVEDQGYTQPSPIQAQAIPAILARLDIMGCAQTGTGKTDRKSVV